MASVWAELRRRNVVKVAVAYAIVGWLLVEVASVLFETFEAPAWVMKVFATVIIMGFPLAMFFAWAYELTPDGLKHPVRCLNIIKDDISYLKKQPGHNHIGDRYTDDIASF